MRHPIWAMLCLVGGRVITGSIALAAPQRSTFDLSQGVVVATSGQLSISDVRVTSRTDSTARISWTTNIAATGQVTYSASRSNPQIVADVHPDGSTSNTTHLVTLTGLSASQTYTLSVQSSDTQSDNVSTSSQTFTTGPVLAPPTTYSTAFTAFSATGNPLPNALLFFSTQDNASGTSDTWAGMTDSNGAYSIVLPLRKQALDGYVSGVNGTLTVSGVDPSGNSVSASYNLSNQGSLPSNQSITFPAAPTPTRTPTAISGPAQVSTAIAGNAIQVSVPDETVPILQIAVTTPSAPPAITPVAQDQQVFAIEVDAEGASGAIHNLSAPLQISITFRPSPNVNPLLAEIYTIDSNGQTQALATQVTNNGDGTYTARAYTSHLSPFVIYAPGVGTPIPVSYVPLTVKNYAGGGW